MALNMETWIKLNAQTAGKDKLARLLQYASRALWHVMYTNKMSSAAVGKLKSLEYNFSTFRKLLRLGKSVEVLYGAFKTIHIEDLTVRLTVTLSKIASALFLLSDHILWLGRSGLGVVDTSKWSDISNRYWLYSIIMNLVRDFYEIKKIVDRHHLCSRMKSISQDFNGQMSSIACLFINEHKDVFWDTLRNGCDVWIPLTALGYTKFKPGTIGILGTISSIAGIVSLVSPYAKLVPS